MTLDGERIAADAESLVEHGRHICELAQESAAAEDAEAALRALRELRSELDGFVRAHAKRALGAGRSFSDVARALGISRQAAHRRFRDLAPALPPDSKSRLVATAGVRRAVALARREAAGGSPGSEHVLLGILQTDSAATRALRSEGVTLERARACVRRPRPDGSQRNDGNGIRRILQQAGRAVLGRGDAELDVDELLRAALADPDGGARRTLQAAGVEPASLRRLSTT
jgi:hypothetical protein